MTSLGLVVTSSQICEMQDLHGFSLVVTCLLFLGYAPRLNQMSEKLSLYDVFWSRAVSGMSITDDLFYLEDKWQSNDEIAYYNGKQRAKKSTGYPMKIKVR